jgi:hypothetical protein
MVEGNRVWSTLLRTAVFRRERSLQRTIMSAAPSSVATDQLRTAVRFPMKLALEIKTTDGVIEAMTENISANGILFTGPRLPAVDSHIEFTIKMPAEVMGTPEDLSIHCIGRVVRHTQEGDVAHAAAIIDEYFLRV